MERYCIGLVKLGDECVNNTNSLSKHKYVLVRGSSARALVRSPEFANAIVNI